MRSYGCGDKVMRTWLPNIKNFPTRGEIFFGKIFDAPLRIRSRMRKCNKKILPWGGGSSPPIYPWGGALHPLCMLGVADCSHPMYVCWRSGTLHPIFIIGGGWELHPRGWRVPPKVLGARTSRHYTTDSECQPPAASAISTIAGKIIQLSVTYKPIFYSGEELKRGNKE